MSKAKIAKKPATKKVRTSSVESARSQISTTPARLSSILKSARDIMRKDKGLNGDLDRLPLLTWIMFLKFLDDFEIQREAEAIMGGHKFFPIIKEPYRWRDWASTTATLTGDDLKSFITQEKTIFPEGKEKLGLFQYLKSLGALSKNDLIDQRQVIANIFSEVDLKLKSGYLLKEILEVISKISFGSSAELHTLGALYENMLREMRDAAGDSGEFYTPRPIVRMMVQILNPRLGETVLDPASGTGGFLVESFVHLGEQVNTIEDHKILQTSSILGCEAKNLPYLLCQMNLLLHGLNVPQIDPLNALRFRLTEIGDKDRVDIVLANPPFGGEEEDGIKANFPLDKQTSETALLFLQLIMRRLRRDGKSRAAVIVPNSTLFDTGVATRIRENLIREFNLKAVIRLPKFVFEPYTDIETNILIFGTDEISDEILFYQLPMPEGVTRYSKTKPLRFEELSECIAILKSEINDSVNLWRVPKQKVLADPKILLDLHNPKTPRGTSENPRVVVDQIVNGLDEMIKLGKKLHPSIEALEKFKNLNFEWVDIPIGDFLSRRKDVVDIDDSTTYKRLRIQLKGRGVLVRDEVEGEKIGTKRQFTVESGMFVLSKIDALNGAFGLVPEEGDGAIITGNFWAYDANLEKINPKLLVHLTRSDAFIEFCRISSPGVTNRRYLQEQIFLAQKVKVPKDVDAQVELCKLFDYFETVSMTYERDLKRIAKHSALILQASLHSIFGGSESISDEEEVEEAAREE